MQVAELEAQGAAEPVPVGEKEVTSQSVEQLEAQVQTKDQVSSKVLPRASLPGNPGFSEQTRKLFSLGDPDFEESKLGNSRSS